MSPRDCPGDDSLALKQAVDALCDRFEEAWQRGDKPDLAAFLPAEERLRQPALVELACIDLEWRLRAGDVARVERYLAIFPEVRANSAAMLRLVTTEARVRLGREKAFNAAEFRDRFPDLVTLPGWESAVPTAVRAEQAADSSDPVAKTANGLADDTTLETPRDDTRLRLGKEIDRGGMGAVHRGHDDRMRREVAVKVLLEKYADEPEMGRRLLEEARITGRLRHPGIVPVHDIGNLPDGRPYFTMKLIEGRTLANLLKERMGAEQERPRFLKIFEQVCQALASAHSEGVIHRDLKPHNVMVGAFGEVQVMDWGLAKVLVPSVSDASQKRSSEPGVSEERFCEASLTHTPSVGEGLHTQEGAVMGTFAYLAPEQARGDVQRVDARSDVFGLGAILCQILTGQPAYSGADRNEVSRRAVRADLADAFARLEGCGADVELTALAKRSLAPEPMDRPADAGVLAMQLTTYLESVEARLRQAELDRARAELKATEERKRRKVQLALAAALLLAVICGGGGVWLWQAINASLLPRLEAVQRMQKQAREHPLGDPALFRAAAKAARDVEGLARKSIASAHVRRQAEALANELEGEADAAARDRRLLAALLEVHASEGLKYSNDDQGMLMALAEPSADDQFALAFREWGVDVDSTPTEEATALFRERPAAVVAEVVAALDEWASQLRPGQMPARLQWAAALAQALDNDPGSKRRELRAMLTSKALRYEYALSVLAMALRPVPVPFHAGLGTHRTRLLELVRTTDVASEPVPGLLTLMRALRVSGNGDVAVSLLRAALRARPQEVVLHNTLGQLLTQQKRWQRAVEVYATMRGIRPELGIPLANALIRADRVKEGFALFERLRVERKDNPLVPLHHGTALSNRQRRHEEAEAAFREAIRLKPDFPAAHCSLGFALGQQGRPEEAEAAFREAIRLKPHFPAAYCNLGVALGQQGRSKDAEAAYRKAIRLGPHFPAAYCNLGVALGQQGRHKEAEDVLLKAIRVNPYFPEAYNNLGNALGQQGRHKKAEDALREAIRLKPHFPAAYCNLGVALGQQGRPKDAEAAFREAIRLNPDSSIAHCNLGNALGQQGRHKEAEDALLKAIRLKRDYPEAYNHLGVALGQQGRPKEAEAALLKAIRLKRDYPEAHCNLGHALREQGRFPDALISLRKGHELGSNRPGWSAPSGLWVWRCERLVELDRRLQKIRDGEAEPTRPRESLELAAFCQKSKRLYHTAVQLADGAFAADPKLADGAPRYFAACSAALAAAGRGEDARLLPDRVVVGLRRRALTWLRANLVMLAGRLKRNDPRTIENVRQRLLHWQKEADLASVRDKEALARLPEDERAQWQRLWTDVADLLKKTQPKD